VEEEIVCQKQRPENRKASLIAGKHPVPWPPIIEVVEV